MEWKCKHSNKTKGVLAGKGQQARCKKASYNAISLVNSGPVLLVQKHYQHTIEDGWIPVDKVILNQTPQDQCINQKVHLYAVQVFTCSEQNTMFSN